MTLDKLEIAMNVRINKKVLSVAVMLLAGLTVAHADDKTPKPPVDIDDMPLSAAPVGKPQATVGAGSRSGTIPAPDIFVLAPRQTGASMSTQPTLYWFMDGETDADIDFVIVPQAMDAPAKGKIQAPPIPLLKKTYVGHQTAGVYTVSLAAEKVTLEKNQQYQVTVMLHASPENDHSKNPYSIAYLAIVDPPAPLPENPDGRAFAKAGFWYDAVDSLIQSNNNKASTVAQRQLFGLMWKEHVFLAVPVASLDQPKPDLTVAQKNADEQEAIVFRKFAAIVRTPQGKK
jgi:Domain of Unknown Function (DUF928)